MRESGDVGRHCRCRIACADTEVLATVGSWEGQKHAQESGRPLSRGEESVDCTKKDV